MRSPGIHLVFSCEHATCAVPEAHRALFKGAEDELTSDEGWEPGVLNLAQAFSMKFHTPLVHGDVTRLLINLEHDGDARWSRFTKDLPEATRLKIADRHERPFRTQLTNRIIDASRRHEQVLHVLLHTSPEARGRVLLESFSAMRPAEEITSAWRGLLRTAGLEVMHLHNATPNALENFLIGEFANTAYLPIRLTVAQSFFLRGEPWRWDAVKKALIDTLPQAIMETSSVGT